MIGRALCLTANEQAESSSRVHPVGAHLLEEVWRKTRQNGPMTVGYRLLGSWVPLPQRKMGCLAHHTHRDFRGKVAFGCCLIKRMSGGIGGFMIPEYAMMSWPAGRSKWQLLEENGS
ncbi:hypothetical protein ABW21_db0201384 [Orbilia brochopaga]|nr:hypothetical protein ABW21_db0201384 [Drechslerella brochopaga]